jgi:hypothetical protein
VSYDNSVSTPTLTAHNVQDAIDQLENQIVNINAVNVWQGENIGSVPQSGGHPVKSLQTQVNDATTRITAGETKDGTQDTAIAANASAIAATNTRIDNLVLTFPAGTKMLFVQPAPPTGWTLDATVNNRAIRVVNTNTGGTLGGAVPFSTVFANTVVGNHTLTLTEIAAHVHDTPYGLSRDSSGPYWFVDYGGPGYSSSWTAGTTSAGGGGSHNHTLDIRVQYVDVCVGIKS